MSKPLTPPQIVAAFRLWDVRFERHAGWRYHRRDPEHGAWGPVHGIIIHHTGDDAPDDADARVLWEGRAGLPGPLCTWGQTDTGVALLIGGGRANHAGVGSSRTLSKVMSEKYTGNLIPGPDDTDGNTHFYGQETMYSGAHNMTNAAYRNTLRACAAICHAHGWSAQSVIGHKEWTKRKPDPGHLDMAQFRHDLQQIINRGHN